LATAFRIVSWNVCGLRALLAKFPDALIELARDHDADVLCLQETKLQTVHVAELGLEGAVPGYDGYFSCSSTKKGYSGTAAFVRRRAGVPRPAVDASGPSSSEAQDSGESNGGRKKQRTLDGFFAAKPKKASKKTSGKAEDDEEAEPGAGAAEAAVACADDEGEDDGSLPPELARLLVPERVSFGTGEGKHDGEGRVVVLEFPRFTACNVYVPNSGQALARLPYRVDEWDKDWLRFCAGKRGPAGDRPVMWLGDLNVAHTSLEVWNDGAKHLAKQAGVTAEERASFQHQLDAGYVDAFRRLHPGARGHYTYWSQRAGNRAPNKGLRLDYFVCDPSFFAPENGGDGGAGPSRGSAVVVRDSYMLPDVQGSDHCPVVLEMEVKL
jgi:exodeoxyribonuclease III